MQIEATAATSETTLVIPTPSSSASSRRRQSTLRLRSPATTSDSDGSSSSKSFFSSLGIQCSPFVSLTALSALFLLVVPTDFLLYSSHSTTMPRKGELVLLEQQEEEFSCGGGPFSYYAASIVSIPCDRHNIHLCCEEHDRCYEQRHLNQSFCDDRFCACLETIRSSSYCETLAQPGLCLATRVFGHLFHWSANCTANEDGRMPPECAALEGTISREDSSELSSDTIFNASQHPMLLEQMN